MNQIETTDENFVVSMSSDASADDLNIKQWKIKKLVRALENARGNGTSMISIIIPPKDQISRVNRMLTEEMGTATNIKSRVNRLSVLTAITSAQQRLKLWTKTPDNGLVLYVGTVLTEDNKERKVAIDFEPFKPINTSLYLCDNKFHVEHLSYLLENEDKYGFIVVDGAGCLYGVVQGNSREVLHKFSVELPKKHHKGGQSSVRFARLRIEKRHNYLRRVAEMCPTFFITNDRPNVRGIILAGSADFKNELAQSQMFDQRLASIVLKAVDVNYGGLNGFNQAIELSMETLKDVKFVQEKQVVSKFFEEIATDSGKVCFGVHESLKALDAGAVESIILFEGLEATRNVVRNPQTGEEKVVVQLNKEDKNDALQKDAATGVSLDLVSSELITEFLADNYSKFGAKLEFISGKSQEGTQFIRGFGGIGCMLRYKLEMEMDDGPTSLDADDIFM